MEDTRRVVIITGAARGIGFGIAECFAELGDTLLIADMDEAAAGGAADRLNAMGAAGSIGIRCDVTQRGEVEAMTRAVVERFDRIDVLVNNAGICPFIHAMEMPPETWLKTIDVNLNGAFHCTQLVAREMIARKTPGRIVNITSLSENVTSAQQVDYGASKAGLLMLTRGFAIALGPQGITVNAVAPGMILTDMTRWHWEKPENAAFIKSRVPVGRIGTPRDIGQAVAFLASRQAEYINGVSLRVDGGHQAVCA